MKQLHNSLCFRRAFPASLNERREADRQLHIFEPSGRSKLTDSGIAGTRLHYRFSFHVAKWLARKAPGCVSIDWPELDACDRLDELLQQVLLASEEDYFDSGYVNSEDWVALASAGFPGTDFDWLLAQLQDVHLQKVWAQLYDAADLPLAWDIGASALSKTRNVFRVRTIATRENGMRERPANAKREIMRALPAMEKLPKNRGARLVDVAMASLAARHRETNHFNHANPDEVYLADVGKGVSVAVFGLAPEHRYPLECTMGFLILSNGVPIGYGGSSALFLQVNTGINIFDEYRGSEAAFLWVQVMRVYHALLGCTRFVVDAYQFGAGNREALESGAFWFYFRLGFRPVDPGVRTLATREAELKRRKPAYRSNLSTLRKLACCDMQLTLPDARQSEFFNEDWIATSSMLATQELAAVGGKSRSESVTRVVSKVARALGMRSFKGWPTAERHGFERIAPLVAATHPADWPATTKASMRKLLRAKGGSHEAVYARLLGEHDHFRSALRAACRRADG